MLPGGAWTTAVLTVLLTVAAAKAHGRQVRLERERAGVKDVDFRRDNGPVVEAIWRRDRIRFWSAFALLAALAVGANLWRPVGGWPLPGALLASLAWAFAGAFCVSGLGSWAKAPADWGSFGWWTLVAAVAALVAWSV